MIENNVCFSICKNETLADRHAHSIGFPSVNEASSVFLDRLDCAQSGMKWDKLSSLKDHSQGMLCLKSERVTAAWHHLGGITIARLPIVSV